MDDITVDLGPLTLHQARVNRHALQMAMRSGEFTLRENYDAAFQVEARLGYRIAKAEQTATYCEPA